MSRPPKPVSVIKSEKVAHRTKKELIQREQGEKALLTSIPLKERDEVKNNIAAHKEFLRVSKLLDTIDKSDSMYEPIINRYCLMQAECIEFVRLREKMYSSIEKLEEKLDDMELDEREMMLITSELAKISQAAINLDKQVQTKRKMLLDIEKECVMTIASALRNVPKKEEKKVNPLLEALAGD